MLIPINIFRAGTKLVYLNSKVMLKLDSPFNTVVPKRWFVTPFGVTEPFGGGSDRL